MSAVSSVGTVNPQVIDAELAAEVITGFIGTLNGLLEKHQVLNLPGLAQRRVGQRQQN